MTAPGFHEGCQFVVSVRFVVGSAGRGYGNTQETCQSRALGRLRENRRDHSVLRHEPIR